MLEVQGGYNQCTCKKTQKNKKKNNNNNKKPLQVAQTSPRFFDDLR